MENYREIKGFEGLYEINILGSIRSIPRNSTVKKVKIMKLFLISGYPKVSLCKNGKYKHLSIHRLIALEFIPNPLNLPFINHKDGNRLNNSVDNLEWCTQQENNLHARRELKSALGEESGLNKLTELQVKEIRNNYKENRQSYKTIGDKYNVSKTCIMDIVREISWRHIL